MKICINDEICTLCFRIVSTFHSTVDVERIICAFQARCSTVYIFRIFNCMCAWNFRSEKCYFQRFMAFTISRYFHLRFLFLGEFKGIQLNPIGRCKTNIHNAIAEFTPIEWLGVSLNILKSKDLTQNSWWTLTAIMNDWTVWNHCFCNLVFSMRVSFTIASL